ncbi:Nucleotidyltransferase substrate binding protein like [Cyclobacterium xiamenense]|uniref:Nucleotidyltransferase substrate binding protein like n=1 Tax=Cyclobacterium xiamenense TaxID=1297121 RepID=A0A1H6ZZR7_9BACT|nr:nucleotidyltransferase substrate binding protein [Cyclobacterium xiamenense]SEJ58831.1 Nucleotidyltransferase substrate binding protein like [Cyclobacterium xiamenense]
MMLKKWMDMIKSRNSSSHTYNEAIAAEIAQKIITQYFEAFFAFKIKMEQVEADLS